MHYPVNLNIEDKPCVVIGGGQVALRKVVSLLSCGARVTVISPEVESKLKKLADEKKLVYCNREYQEGDLKGAYLVFAATNNSGIQKAVGTEAQLRGVLLNSVDDPDRCDFQVPAAIRRGNLLLTVSTGGASPALSKLLREELEQRFGEEYDSAVRLLGEIRKVVVTSDDDSEAHKILFTALLKADFMGYVKRKEWQKLEELLRRELPQGTRIESLLEVVR